MGSLRSAVVGSFGNRLDGSARRTGRSQCNEYSFYARFEEELDQDVL